VLWFVLTLITLGITQAAYGATATIHVTVNTTPLIDHPAGPFSMALAMTDGNGIGDGNNTVTLSDVDFGGGAATGDPVTFGGVTGSLASGIVLTDSAFLHFL